MHRRSLLSSAAVGALAGLAAAGGLAGGTVAQEGTPTPGATDGAAAVKAEELADARVADLPSAPAAFRLIRYRLEPGATLVAEASEPSLALIYVERGTLTARVDTPVTVGRGPRLGTPVAEVAAGVEFQLGPGDSFAFPPSAAGEIRNDGGRAALLLASVSSRSRPGQRRRPLPRHRWLAADRRPPRGRTTSVERAAR